MKVIFFSERSKFYIDFEIQANFQKMLMVLKIVAHEFNAGVSVNYDKNTCDCPSLC